MPTYEYRCRTCDARFEVQQSFSEDSLTHCPGAASEQGPAACVAPGEGEVRKVYTLSPDGGEIPGLEFVAEGDRIRFTLPRLETYTLVVIQL